METSAGFVLTGGRSSRMGRDKALLPIEGSVLVERTAEQVRIAAGSVTLIGAPERYAHLGLPVVPDLIEDCGPIGGLYTALKIGRADWNLLVACDMPALTAEFLRELARRRQAVWKHLPGAPNRVRLAPLVRRLPPPRRGRRRIRYRS